MSKGERLVSQASTLYKALYDQSTVVEAEGQEVRVWKGSIVNTSLDVGIPYGSYGAVVKALVHIGCIQQIRSGARNNPTVIVLLNEPTEQMWATYSDGVAEALTKRRRSATLLSEAERIISELGGIDIAKALLDHEKRITVLEQTAQGLKEGQSGKKPQGK